MRAAGSSSTKALFLIRIAMAVGVTTFIVVAWFLQGRGQSSVSSVKAIGPLTTVMYTSVGVAAAIVMALRLRIDAAQPAMQRALAVVAWAVGEFAGLFGGVMMFLTGEWRFVLPGVLVFALSLAAVRIPE